MKLHLLLILLFTLACQKERPEQAPPWESLKINGLMNSGFEWVADSTTKPHKFGAYWSGAFVYEEGASEDLIDEAMAFKGKRSLKLTPRDGVVYQKIACDPRWTDELTVNLAYLTVNQAGLKVTLEDGPGNKVTRVLKPSASWRIVDLDLGKRFLNKPVPRLRLILECQGAEGSCVYVDEVYASAVWPAVTSRTLKRQCMEMVLKSLQNWYLAKDQGGWGMVDPTTGYPLWSAINVNTGRKMKPAHRAGLHTIHRLLLGWLKFVKKENWKEQSEFWTPHLKTYLNSFLKYNFFPKTDLPCIIRLKTKKPVLNTPITVGAYMDFLVEACDVLEEGDLKQRCLDQARRTADRLLVLQKAHDLTCENQVTFNRKKGVFQGNWPNWFGHIPKSLTPQGGLQPPKRYNNSWAIVTGWPHWYHFFKSAASINDVMGHQSKAGDQKAVRRVLSLYSRKWDAARYDLENDTDDLYGYLCEDLMRLIRKGNYPRAYQLVKKATDHRLDPACESADQTLWIQGVRLGTACAGDCPRAFKGVADFHEIKPLPLYSEALLELAQNDFKGRMLTNSQFTESFYKNWEMVCICYRDDYQGDCRDRPKEFWDGDVGDLFGGPPHSAINAQIAAYRVAPLSQRQLILSSLEVIRHVTDQALKRPFGYLYGLDPAVAHQYELPEKYVIGLRDDTAAELSYVMGWFELMLILKEDSDPVQPRVSLQNGRFLLLQGNPGDHVALLGFQGNQPPPPKPISHKDRRMLDLPLPENMTDGLMVLDPGGEKKIPIPKSAVLVQPVTLDPESGEILAIGQVLSLKP